ncbi:hypothetical protein [Fulvivirga ligni]|uniref:hypothetical protein n=1 Tax=Fulvivirga ligni TaxID=2904246 RepID=UPI001F266D02|nr:hypothetical protein [Fulvivirga ligni]UII22502.1 hypothetical protein LVD16_04575 [Fulvivirga ligni]
MFGLSRYKIAHSSNQKLVITTDKNYVLVILFIAIIAFAIFGYSLWDKINFNKIDILEVSLIGLAIGVVYAFVINIKVLFEGEEYIFDQSLNSIEKNNLEIGKLDKISSIKIIEHQDAEYGSEYELNVYVESYGAISFRKTKDLGSSRELGAAISKISGISFSFKSSDEMRQEERQENKKASYDRHVELFEKKFDNKSESELLRIAQVDSKYADYAKQAALNILERKVIEKESTTTPKRHG